MLIRQQAGESISLQKKIPSVKGDFLDYRPRMISKTNRALQKERDKTIFIKMKVKLVGSNISPPSTKSGEPVYDIENSTKSTLDIFDFLPI